MLSSLLTAGKYCFKMRCLIVFALVLAVAGAAFGEDFKCPLSWKFSQWENECTAICLKSVEIGDYLKQIPVRLVPVGKECGSSKTCQYANNMGPVTGVCA